MLLWRGLAPGTRAPHPGHRATRITGLERGRSANSALHLGVQIGLDYVCCSPYRIPVARLEAARAVLMDS
ncbi:hypothetical protein FNM00_14840 [Aeromicrobium piscarium]|uniref:Uncharacterized protein n=1 Tax=Aeromicrobium piscarium TaxID=2590901 RepID=A0A554RVT7_9ACTN|nr:hypothetical protein FNM00_14840 [Aeromicrobium piscarium]